MSQKLWGGRFGSDITSEVLDYTLTVDVDVRLWYPDLWQDLAHTLMLGRQGIIPADTARDISGALLSLYDAGEIRLRPEFEDVHLNIEQLVIEELGRERGGHMHTARSRNDQVATDTRIYLRDVALEAVETNLDLIAELLDLSPADYIAILPGYTHSQAAQPVTVAFWRTAHASLLLRDVGRIRDALGRIDECPLGACALAGTSFPLDRPLVATLLGFPTVLTHALDATSARDHMIELSSAFAIGANSLSRMAEEIVVWSGHEYSLVEVADAFATGSSIMPQKKNPVVAELVRGRSGRTLGGLVQLFTAVKSVGLGYSCDLQEDKPYLWGSIDAYLSTLRIVRGQLEGLRFDTARGEQLCWDNFSTATELANYLSAERGVAFRTAHHITGTVVAGLIAEHRTLRDVERAHTLLLDQGHDVSVEVLGRLFDPRSAVTSYTSLGATSPDSVRATHRELSRKVTEQRAWSAERRSQLDAALAVTLAAARAVVAGEDLTTAISAATAELSDLVPVDI